MTEQEKIKKSLKKALAKLYKLAQNRCLCDDERDEIYNLIEQIERDSK